MNRLSTCGVRSPLSCAALAALLVLLAFATTTACDTDSPAADGGVGDASQPDPAESACLEEGEPGTPVAATETRDSTTPEVVAGAEPYLVSLPPTGTGYLRVRADAAGEEVILFFEATGVLTNVYGEADAALGVVSAGPNPFCAEAQPEHHDVDFEAPGTYYLELTAGSDVWLLVLGAEGHGD